jgi:two-component system copper resistance phosphate regulon response regulator CusR
MRILIIEDEHKIAAYIYKGLTSSGFSVDIAHNGVDGLHFAREYFYNVIILDIMLPNLNGWSVIKEIRRINSNVRILVVSALGDVDDRVKGLELGADDYLIKPFAFSELLARIRSLLRRETIQVSTDICIADLKIELTKHKALRGNSRLDLAPKEFALLVLLAQHTGEVLSRTLIAERIWDIHFDCDSNVIDVAIRRLRQKVDDHYDCKLIHTVRGLGYVLEAR